MRVLVWNCRRAGVESLVWDYFRELSPDIALLQEVGAVPSDVKDEWSINSLPAATKTGGLQRFATAILARGELVDSLSLTSHLPWVQSELTRFSGNLVGSRIRLGENGAIVNTLSVYSPAWPLDRARLQGIDTTEVRLALNADVWLTDILLAGLRDTVVDPGETWLIGGDLNLSETFDEWSGGPRGNREYLERVRAFGLTECLRQSRGVLTPTFRNPRGGSIIHQMDHLFVSPPLAARLASCVVGSAERVFVTSASDHLPIIADFRKDP